MNFYKETDSFIVTETLDPNKWDIFVKQIAIAE
jgi:hypothetical protein